LDKQLSVNDAHNYIYDFLQILCTFAAVPNEARIVDVFRNWRLMTILQIT